MKRLYSFKWHSLFRERRNSVTMLTLLLGCMLSTGVFAQTPFPMQSGTYTEDFANINNWTANFAASGGELVPNHSHWGSGGTAPTGLGSLNVGFIPASNAIWSTGSSGGIQRNSSTVAPNDLTNPAGKLVLLTTGGTDNTSAAACDLYLDFRNRTAGTISLDWASVNNSTGNRVSTFRVYALNTAGTQFVQIGTDVTITNNTLTTGSISLLALPSHFDYNQSARLRFYITNVGGGTSGSRPKIAVDNISITSTACVPTKLVVTDVNAGNCPAVGVPFNTIVQSQSASNNACAVTANTNLSLTLNTGTGSVAGTTTTTLNSASFQNTFTFTGLTYDVAETGVSLNIAGTSGPALTAGNSATFESIASYASEPTTQGTISTSGLAFNSVVLTLSGGNGANRVVVARAGSAVANAPTDGVAYTANNFFGSGSTTAAGQFVVFNGSGSSVTVNGLVQGTTYHFAAFESNGIACAVNFKPNLTGIASVTAPTQSLVAGDISFVQFRGDAADGFAFVALTNIGGGTTLRFTDASWIGDATNGVTGDKFLASEADHYLWTSPLATGGITAGTVVTLQGSLVSVGTLTDTLGGAKTILGLSNSGENLFAYRGARTRPQVVLLAGFASRAFTTGVPVVSASNSFRPGALAGSLAVELGGGNEADSYLNIPNLCGTPSSLRTLISSPANWFTFSVINPLTNPQQDFQVATFWNFNLVGALATEPTLSGTATTASPQTSGITLNLGVGNGSGRVVIAKLTSNAVNTIPTDGVTYTSNLVYGTIGTEAGLGSGNFVVYSGSAPSIVVSSLNPLTSYTFTVYEFNDAPCVNYKTASPVVALGTTTELKYFSKSAQSANLQNLSAWSLTPDGTGASPSDFTTPGISYVIDDANSTIGATWSVGGASTKVTVVSPGSFTVPVAFSLTTAGGSGVSVGSNAILNLLNASLPTISSVDSTTSTVNFDMAGTVIVPAFSYYNLGLRNGTKGFPVGTGTNGVERLDNTIRVKGNLIVDGTTLDPAGSPFSFLAVHGNVTSLNSSVWGTLTDGLTLTFRGNFNQTFSKVGGGPIITLFKLAANKPLSGALVFGSSNNIVLSQDMEFNLGGFSSFIDGGNTFDVGDDLRLTGAAGNYFLTGTIIMTGTTTGDQHNIEDASNNALAAILNNVTVSTPNGTDEVRFAPNSGTSIITIKGNINITTLNAVLRFYDNNIRLGGNFTNSSNLTTSLNEGASTLTLNGTGLQTIQTLVPNEVYRNIVSANASGGVTFQNPFTVTGNWTNTGLVSLGTNAVTFTGTATQTIAGKTTFADLIINTTAGTGFTVGATSKVSVAGTVTFGSNADLTINGGGEFRLLSNATGTARIANTAAGTLITGNITSERYVPVEGWHFTGTALSGQNIMDWNDNLATQGPMTGVETYNGGYFTSTIYEFDQTNNDPIPNYPLITNGGWKIPSGSAIIQNKGYRVFIPAGSTLDNTGSYTTGTKTLTLTGGGISSPGWNLLLNPHLSPVLRTGFAITGSVQNAIVFWDPTAEAYRYEGSALGGWTILAGGSSPIASGQGFFMFTPSSGSVDIPETAKSTGGTFFRTNTNPTAVEIQLKNSQGQMDAALFQFLNDAQPGYDTQYDAQKLMNPGLNVYSINIENNKLAINGLPFDGDQMVMPIGFKAGQGSYSLTFLGLDILNDANEVFLKDNETGMIQDLNQNAIYSFVNAASGINNDRFELIFTNSVTGLSSVIQSSVVVYPNPVNSGTFTVATANLNGAVTIVIMDMLGRKVESKVVYNLGLTSEIQMVTPSVSGQYSVKVSGSNGTVVKSLIVK